MHPRPAGAAVSQPYPRRWLALYVLVLARVMDLFDGAVTSVAGPSIQASFGSGQQRQHSERRIRMTHRRFQQF